MTLLLTILLLFNVCLKLFPPKKPNYLYGYQLGSAKKSLEHWKVANKYASSYSIVLYAFMTTLSLVFDNGELNTRIPILIFFIIGLVLVYYLVEKKLKNDEKKMRKMKSHIC
ncbi:MULTISPECIES: SdpI family protein [Flavobacterium]|uniref:SdpI family protein n=1 Tax=Flavobacterium TaxID=237 RepID=UPI001FCC3103|nr:MULTISPECIES: SdpI family protein [Flavobacterium]UOK41593.1 SdpI family protein [Flavobacterium enshiense]